MLIPNEGTIRAAAAIARQRAEYMSEMHAAIMDGDVERVWEAARKLTNSTALCPCAGPCPQKPQSS